MDFQQIENELVFKAVRSSGPGGQHANKTATKVELHFHINNSQGLNAAEKSRVQRKLEHKINREGYLRLYNEESRSQHANKETVISNLQELLEQALKRKKLRKKTKPTKASKLKRLQSKKRRADTKNNRKNPLK